MQKAFWRTVLAVALAFPLGGCSSIFGLHLFSRNTSKAEHAPTLAEAATHADVATQAGRSALDANHPGEAIEKFQQALADDEPIAPALNGLAVAYARIGRLDLAQRYFQQAIAVEPDNERYLANLAALTRSPLFRMRHDGDVTAKLMRESPQTTPNLSAQRTAQAPQAGQLQRVSRYEVRITTGPSYPAPVARERGAAVARSVAPNLKGFNPIVRVTLPDAKPTAKTVAPAKAVNGFRPLVRLTLSAPRPTGSASFPVIERR